MTEPTEKSETTETSETTNSQDPKINTRNHAAPTPTDDATIKRVKKSEKKSVPKHSSAQHTNDVIETAWHKQVRPRVWRTVIIASVLAAVGLVAYRVADFQWWGILVVFTAALVVGETLELRLVDRPPIPISFAAIMALARTNTDNGAFSWTHVSIVMVAAIFLSTICYANVTLGARVKISLGRAAAYFAGACVARFSLNYVDASSQWLYAVLIVSVIVMLAVHEVFAIIEKYPRTYGFFAAAAHASVIAGGVLIGVGYAGTKVVTQSQLIAQAAKNAGSQSIRTAAEAGGNGLGISALITCAIPLLVAWFAFSRYYSALRTYRQTIRALSAAPELGGIVSWGHADRVAQLALAVADRLDLARDDRQAIETAAYMHTLGDAVLDTTMEVDPAEEAEAARVTAEIVRSAGGLDRVADIIDDHVRPYRGVIDGNLVAQNDIAASVMRVANDYDNISRRDETWGSRAIVAMLNAPAATYNPRALEALEWVLQRERFADLIEPPQVPAHVADLLNS